MGLENVENVTCFSKKSLVHVGKNLETKLQYFDRYLRDKNILEYVQILVTDGGFMILWILYIEGHSNYYIISLRNYDELLKFLQPKRMSTTMWPM